MKYFSIYILLILTFHSHGQKTNKLIRQAERNINNSHYKKALRLLKKVESKDLGFCGISVIEIQEQIVSKKIKIYDFQGQYLKSANELNNISYYLGQNLDSLKMTYFLKEFDKNLIKYQLDSCLKLLDSLKYDDFYSSFPLNVQFSEKPFKLSYETMQSLKKKTFINNEGNKNIDILERFKTAIKTEPFYLLLI